tara:strand:- start:1120 stop:1590 length:471 start_codon:yes stop_codon:yes gene_type:complete
VWLCTLRIFATEPAVTVLQEQKGNHAQFCFTYQSQPILWDLTNTAWMNALRKAGIEDFRFHDLRHTWASWHRQAGTSCDELKDLGGWKSRSMVDRYAKFATENLANAASRIEAEKGGNVIPLSHFCHISEGKQNSESDNALINWLPDQGSNLGPTD